MRQPNLNVFSSAIPVTWIPFLATIVTIMIAAAPLCHAEKPTEPLASAVQQLQSAETIDALVKALRDGDPATRLKVLKGGKHILRRDFKQAVIACVDHKDERVRDAAILQVFRLRLKSAYPRR